MFSKCSLDARNIATLREHSANIPGILHAGWAVCQRLICDCEKLLVLLRGKIFGSLC